MGPRAALAHKFGCQLKLELLSVFYHGLAIFVPCLPLLGSVLNFDHTYKVYVPTARRDQFSPQVEQVITFQACYFAVTLPYVIFYYVGKQLSGGRPPRDSCLRRLFRFFYYLALFLNMLLSMCVIVCVLYWILLGTILDPEVVAALPYELMEETRGECFFCLRRRAVGRCGPGPRRHGASHRGGRRTVARRGRLPG